MSAERSASIEQLMADAKNNFAHWEKVRDVIDQLIDLMVNYRQSGHPGGSRSKANAMVTTMLSGAMRWDIRNPEKRFADRFILSAGHTAPLGYAALCVMCDVLRTKYNQTKDEKYRIPEHRAVLWEDIVNFRRRGGLPGHAEMSGKTLFFKANTGPSGHGIPIAAGEALALKRAGAEQVKVFAFEGEGGLTPGASHESKNSAYGLGLSNLIFYVDWNNFGIDNQPISTVVAGTPDDWFKPYGWQVFGTMDGDNWEDMARIMLHAAYADNPDSRPNVAWSRNRKGRGYHKYDNKSHGSPHKANSELFWQCRKDFSDKYGVTWEGFGSPAGSPEQMKAQLIANLNVALDVIRNDSECLDYVARRLVELGDSVPETLDGFKIEANPFKDNELYDFRNYPQEIWARPGEKKANRNALATWGAFVNTWARKKYNRPVFLACSADLADSTNISGFAKDFNGIEGWGWFNRETNLDGVLLPQEITEFANAGICCGATSVNLAQDPLNEWNGFMTACSTYGSFVYLKYGLMRLFSQTAQDSDIKTGKVLWVAGHSGPETADDSRTHFGIYAPGVTQLFPEGQVIDLHPWEYNEVPVVIAAALQTPVPIIALHLTRPAIPVPDRDALGMASHFEAAKGAYLIRDYKPGLPKQGCLFVQGTYSTLNLVQLLPELDAQNLNVKIVAAISPQLFAMQPQEYRDKIISPADRMNSTFISNRCRRVGSDWLLNPLAAEYAMTSDWDNRWRTGGTLDEVISEAHLDKKSLLEGIKRFAGDYSVRMQRIRSMLDAATV